MKGSSWESCGGSAFRPQLLLGWVASMKGSSWESCGPPVQPAAVVRDRGLNEGQLLGELRAPELVSTNQGIGPQ